MAKGLVWAVSRMQEENNGERFGVGGVTNAGRKQWPKVWCGRCHECRAMERTDLREAVHSTGTG